MFPEGDISSSINMKKVLKDFILEYIREDEQKHTLLEVEAAVLAERDYSLEITKQENYWGHEIYIARNPEFGVLYASNRVESQAITALSRMRFQVIRNMLIDCIDVPEPENQKNEGASD